MLNMLIAIIGESYNKIMEVQKQANYHERARMISENDFLIPNYRKRERDDEDNYIITAVEVS